MRGTAQTKQISRLTTPNTMLQVPLFVRVFIRIVNVRICDAMINMSSNICPIPVASRPTGPKRIWPASAMLCTQGWRSLNCPMMIPVYYDQDRISSMDVSTTQGKWYIVTRLPIRYHSQSCNSRWERENSQGYILCNHNYSTGSQWLSPTSIRLTPTHSTLPR